MNQFCEIGDLSHLDGRARIPLDAGPSFYEFRRPEPFTQRPGFVLGTDRRGSGPIRQAARRLCQWVGLASISESMRQASVLGDRRPCSQERTVDGSTPRNPAKAAWLVPSRSRTLRTSSPLYAGGAGDSISSHGEPCLQRLSGPQSLGEFANPARISSPLVRAAPPVF